jgi:NodT family efflux transporter outer membrane factor (OMF) lipoprotein
MTRSARSRIASACAVAALAMGTLLAGGCATIQEWVQNGFKVGPGFHQPPATLASSWIDAGDPKLASLPPPSDGWWSVFRDPVLDYLIDTAYQQNLDLKTAATRVLQAQAQRNIAAGNLFPQTQNLIGDYARVQLSQNFNLFSSPQAPPLPTNINIWATGFNASWELDFWGRLRRLVESANADLDASVEGYHDALVTLLADVATSYVQVRTYQQRIAYARHNVTLQQGSLALAEARLKQGKATALDVKQARSSVAQTEATIPPLVTGLRQANNHLCLLLGLAPEDLLPRLFEGPIPTAPPEVACGLPADLLQRRPDVRRALQQAAGQSAQVGVAEADFYPQLGVTGFLGYAASDLAHLFAEKSFTGLVLPSFQWKILNYGRVLNNVRYQDARLQEKVLQYQQTVLTAGREVEDALVGFLQNQLQARSLAESVAEAEDAVELVQAQYQKGLVDFNRVFTAQGTLVTQEDQLAVARGNIALSLIAVYRALGGGWQFFDRTGPPPACRLLPPRAGPDEVELDAMRLPPPR